MQYLPVPFRRSCETNPAAASSPPEAHLSSPEHAGPVVQVPCGHRGRPRLQDQLKVLRLYKCAGPKQKVVECRHAHSTCCCAFALLDEGRQHAVPAWAPIEVIEHEIALAPTHLNFENAARGAGHAMLENTLHPAWEVPAGIVCSRACTQR
jgi:hypothetical protein